MERHIAGGLGMWVSADYLDVAFPLALTQRILASVSGRWPANMPTRGGGNVRDFDIVFNADKKLAAVSAEAEQLEVLEWGRWPQLSGLMPEMLTCCSVRARRGCRRSGAGGLAAQFPRPGHARGARLHPGGVVG